MPKPKTTAVATFDSGFSPGRLTRCETRTLTGSHEIAILDFMTPKGTNIPTEGSWVTVEHGRIPQWSKTFYGYVNHFERIDNSTAGRSNSYRMYCVGTSKPMNATNPGRWHGVTGSFIARTFAERYSLRCVLSKSLSTMDWVQGNATDFATLRKLAERDGALFWVSGSTLYYVDPTKQIVTAASNSVKTFTRTSPVQTRHTDTLRDMYLIQGSDAPGIDAPQVTYAYGLDSNGTLIKGSSIRAYTDAGLTPPGSTAIHPGEVSSGAEAAQVTASRVFAASWAQMSANVISEDAPVYVGDVVSLAGTAVDQSLQGRWFVMGTTDVLTYNGVGNPFDYTMNLTLTRNQADNHVTLSSKNLTGSSAIVPAIWVGKKWQAKTLEAVYV